LGGECESEDVMDNESGNKFMEEDEEPREG